MKGNRGRIALTVVLSSISALGIPLASMLVIDPEQYGAFSLFYLVGASANILQLAVVSEAWVRSPDENSHENAWRAYINATILVALLGAVVAVAIALAVPEYRFVGTVAAVAIGAQVYRNGSRFRAFRQLTWRYVLPGDTLSAVATLGVIAFLFTYEKVTLDTVMIGWAITRLAGLLGSRSPGRISPRSALGWIKSHKGDISVLSADAAMGDMATIGVQYLLVPIIGLANFGTYRAVGNVGGPVRTVIFPLRPILSRLPHRTLGSASFTIRIAAVGAVLGAAAYAALWALSLTAIDLGTLNSLYPFAPIVGCYVFAMVGDTCYSLMARQVVAGSLLVSTRAVVAFVALAAPLGGALVWGLAGAIWGYVICLGLSSVMWWNAVRRSTREL